VVRGLAILSMYVAHVAPSGGPGQLLNLSEFLTAPLFALVIGCAAALSASRTRWVAVIVRGAALVGLGLLLDRLGAQVDDILPYLGVLVVVAHALALGPRRVTAVITGFFAIAAPVLQSLARDRLGDALGTDRSTALLQLVAAGPHYRLVTLVVWAGVGVLVGRFVVRSPQEFIPFLALPPLVLTAALLVAKRAGWIDLVPYSGSHVEILMGAAIALSVLILGVAAARYLRLGVLARLGRMSLSLYAAQLVLLGAWVGPLGHATDDSWLVLALLVLISLTLSEGWRLLSGPGRGPLEWPLDRLARAGQPAAARRTLP